MKKKYSRLDEKSKPWKLSNLAGDGPPSRSKTGFWSISEFAVFKKLLVAPKPIQQPYPMMMSSNVYTAQWSLKTHRRLKNVIMIMELTPNQMKLADASIAASKGQSPVSLHPQHIDDEAMTRIGNTFNLFDSRGNGRLSSRNVKDVLACVDAFEEDCGVEDYMKKCSLGGDGEVRFTAFDNSMREKPFYNMQPGRYYVILNLVEAEALRGVLHRAKGKGPALPELQNTGIGLRSLFSNTLFDSSDNFQEASNFQTEAMWQCFRFFDSETYFDERGINILVRSLRKIKCWIGSSGLRTCASADVGRERMYQ